MPRDRWGLLLNDDSFFFPKFFLPEPEGWQAGWSSCRSSVDGVDGFP
jgi:hypothetical protein